MVYLEKRPPEGLWGGLWCLPSIANELCPLSYIKQHYSFLGTEAKHLLSIKHRFSHFQLNIDAVQIKIDLLVTPEVETKGLWLKQDQLSQLGLAKPTSDILRQLQKVVSP